MNAVSKLEIELLHKKMDMLKEHQLDAVGRRRAP